MNKIVFIGLLVLVAICVQEAVCQGQKGYGESCSNSCQCSSKYCRGGQCINWGDAEDDWGKENPCYTAECPRRKCYVQQVQCFRPPCSGIANCVSNTQTCS